MDKLILPYTKTILPRKFSSGTPINRRIFGFEKIDHEDDENDEKSILPKCEKDDYED